MLIALFFDTFFSFVHNTNGDFMFYYLNMFIIGSVLGFIMELCLKTFVFTSMNSSILYGPWLPVYGFGICLSIFLQRLIFNRLKVNKIVKIIVLFLLIMLVSTIAEWIGGMFIELVFDKTFWDYRDLRFNIGKYIALEVSIIWGILSLLFLYIIKPQLDKVIKKVPKIITILVLSAMIVDFITTLMIKA